MTISQPFLTVFDDLWLLLPTFGHLRSLSPAFGLFFDHFFLNILHLFFGVFLPVSGHFWLVLTIFDHFVRPLEQMRDAATRVDAAVGKCSRNQPRSTTEDPKGDAGQCRAMRDPGGG